MIVAELHVLLDQGFQLGLQMNDRRNDLPAQVRLSSVRNEGRPPAEELLSLIN
jgi:hypothetical protein